MREILFRARGNWNKDGWLIGDVSFTYLYDSSGERFSDKPVLARIGDYPVDIGTLGQYTGLTDKNGTKIFEGDIVKCHTGRICVVTFFTSPSYSGFDLDAVGNLNMPAPSKSMLFRNMEVIGNIHDNPELIGNI